MIKHTIESLAALHRKTEVVDIAAAMGLDTEGTRAEISARIVEAQLAEPSASEESVEPVPVEVAEPVTVEPVVVEPVTVEPTVAEPVALKLSNPARLSLLKLIGSFLDADAAKADLDNVVKAIEAGKQPCIVAGQGNRRFTLQVFDTPFNPADCATDIPPGRAGVAVNLARRLAVQVLYPRG